MPRLGDGRCRASCLHPARCSQVLTSGRLPGQQCCRRCWAAAAVAPTPAAAAAADGAGAAAAAAAAPLPLKLCRSSTHSTNQPLLHFRLFVSAGTRAPEGERQFAFEQTADPFSFAVTRPSTSTSTGGNASSAATPGKATFNTTGLRLVFKVAAWDG